MTSKPKRCFISSLSSWAWIALNIRATSLPCFLGTTEKMLRKKCTLHRWYFASGKTSVTESHMAWHLSPIISCTPFRPQPLIQVKKFSQLSLSSFIPSVAPKISQNPSLLTSIATSIDNILDFTAPATLEVHAVNLNIRIFTCKRTLLRKRFFKLSFIRFSLSYIMLLAIVYFYVIKFAKES